MLQLLSERVRERNCGTINTMLVSRKMMVLMEGISMAQRPSQNELIKSKSHLTYLIAFSEQIAVFDYES